MSNTKYKNMKKELHLTKRFLQKIGIRFIRMMNIDRVKGMTEAEREAGGILRKLMSDDENELLTSPTTGKYYVKCNKKSMLLVLGDGELSIINHVYGYNVHLAPRVEQLFREQFLDEIEKRRESMESEFRNSVKHSLKEIYKNLENEK